MRKRILPYVAAGITAVASLVGCGERETPVEKVPQGSIPKPYRHINTDNSSVVVVPTSPNGDVVFYVDRNNDSFADVAGRGAYLAWDGGMPRTLTKWDLPEKVHSMDDLFEDSTVLRENPVSF
ncbi:hypothetical protein CMI47_12550 [Candidatus Pacearchaeota archaeon]|nr:hypothetical protein [Candidatus Pacearchaeota archaeon]|tara:strand:+ start:469 stop:837 length:369 start_codon:yes stop_codon:yes gene_type:complete